MVFASFQAAATFPIESDALHCIQPTSRPAGRGIIGNRNLSKPFPDCPRNFHLEQLEQFGLSFGRTIGLHLHSTRSAFRGEITSCHCGEHTPQRGCSRDGAGGRRLPCAGCLGSPVASRLRVTGGGDNTPGKCTEGDKVRPSPLSIGCGDM